MSEVGSTRVGNKGDAYFGDLADQPNSTTDIVAHSCTVHARGDVSHIEAVVAPVVRGRDLMIAESTRRDSIPSCLHVTSLGTSPDPAHLMRRVQ